MHLLTRVHTYISSEFNSLFHSLTAYIPLYNTLADQKPPVLRFPKPICPTRTTSGAMLNAGWAALIASLSFLLTTNLSGSIFGDILGTLQSRNADAYSGRSLALASHYSTHP